MIARTAVLAGGLAGGLGLSQFPEFSQQYVQRLGGAVDELGHVVAGFDADAAKVGLSREQALVEMAASGAMPAARAQSMAGVMQRHARLSADLAAIREAGPFTRAYHAKRFQDTEVARAALADFRPALPLSFEGAVFGGTGFFLGALVLTLLWSLLRWPLRLLRRRGAA